MHPVISTPVLKQTCFIEPCPNCGKDSGAQPRQIPIDNETVETWLECICGYTPDHEWRHQGPIEAPNSEHVDGAVLFWNSAAMARRVLKQVHVGS